MATLNTNNRILVLYSKDHNVALCLNSKSITTLSAPNQLVETKSSLDPYLGLTRYCSALSPNGQLYAVAAEKDLIVWSTEDWSQKCTRILHRSASKITFTPSSDKILVADKTGDVYSYSVNDGIASGCLLLGHLSILLDILVTPDEKFVLTCDRDEKIRVTHYPNTHNIARFCLGHSAFVTKIILLRDDVLLSASGDGTLKFWRYAKGECLASYSVENDVDNCENYCIITGMVVLEEADQLVVCVSVFKFEGVFVYTCPTDTNYQLKLSQKISCYEPLDLVSYESLLWILNYSSSCLLKAFSWDRSNCKYTETVSTNVKDACNIINENCSSIVGLTTDISVLHKKFHLKEQSLVKKIKLA